MRQGINEVLLWKQYNKGLSISHCVPIRLQVGDRTGMTRALVNTFLMKNGLPIYAAGSGYHGDVTVSQEKKTVTNACNCLSGEKKTYSAVIRKTLQ